MHYIRFLNPPKVEIKKPWATVSTLITITTDLGDNFLAAELPVYALLVRDGDGPTRSKKTVLTTAKSSWKPGSRVLRLVTPKLPIPTLKLPVQLIITTTPEYNRPSQVQYATLDSLPSILHVWSSPFDLTHNGIIDWVERRFAVSETLTLRVCEEMGESIARHIWDAGATLAAFIRDILLLPRLQDDDFPFARKMRKASGLNVIELGSGCEIVGLQLAHLCSNARVLLTDLPEALEVLERNISIAALAAGSHVTKAVLNWDETVPEAIAKQVFDLVLISDCTYNSDTIPALVRTLAFLVKRSQEALVIVAMKIRHESEAVFHELMEKVGLHQCGRYGFEVPDKQREDQCLELDTVDIYVYQSRAIFVEELSHDDES